MNDDNGGTRVDVVTDLSITGKVAQFGRGVLDDVSAKLLRQFVENLERDVLPVRRQKPRTSRSTRRRRCTRPRRPTARGQRSRRSTGPRKIDAPEAEPIDLGRLVAGESAARRSVPIVVGVVVLFVVWRLLPGAVRDIPRRGGPTE
jgi:hypothetical protein